MGYLSIYLTLLLTHPMGQFVSSLSLHLSRERVRCCLRSGLRTLLGEVSADPRPQEAPRASYHRCPTLVHLAPSERAGSPRVRRRLVSGSVRHCPEGRPAYGYAALVVARGSYSHAAARDAFN